MKDIDYFTQKKMNAVNNHQFLKGLPYRLQQISKSAILTPGFKDVLQGYRGPSNFLSQDQSGDSQPLGDSGCIQQIRFRYALPKGLAVLAIFSPLAWAHAGTDFFGNRWEWKSLFFDSKDGSLLAETLDKAKQKKKQKANYQAQSSFKTAQELSKRGEMEKALQYYSKAFKTCSEGYVNQQAFKQRLKACQKKIEQNKRNREAQKSFKTAQELSKRGKMESALQHYSKAFQTCSKGYVNQQAFKQRLKACQKKIEQNKRNLEAQKSFKTAQELSKRGEMESALQHYSKAFQTCSKGYVNQQAFRQRLKACKNKIKYLRCQAEQIQLKTTKADQYFIRAKQSYQNRQKLSVTYKLAKSSNQIAPQNYSNKRQLQQFIKSVLNQNQLIITSVIQKANQFKLKGDYRQAVNQFKRASEMIIQNQKQTIYLQQQICQCQQKEKIENMHQETMRNAEILFQQGNYDRAIEHLINFMSKNYGRACMTDLLASIYYEKGKQSQNLHTKNDYFQKAKNIHQSKIIYQVQHIANQANIMAQSFDLQSAERRIKQIERQYGNFSVITDIKNKTSILREAVELLQRELSNTEDRSKEQRQQFEALIDKINQHYASKSNNQSLRIVMDAITLRRQLHNKYDIINQLQDTEENYVTTVVIIQKICDNIKQQQRLIERMGILISAQLKAGLNELMLQFSDNAQQVKQMAQKHEKNKHLIMDIAIKYQNKLDQTSKLVNYEQLITKEEAQIV